MKIFALINDGYKIIYHKDYSIVEDWKYIYQENFAILRIFEIDVEEDNESDDINLVLEETQKLRVQLNDYEKELIDMNESVMSSHRVLNIVVFILVLVLIVMLGFAIYWVLYSKGYY